MYGNKSSQKGRPTKWMSENGSHRDDASQCSTESSDKHDNGGLRNPDIGQRIHLLFKNQMYTDVKFVLSCGIKPKPFVLAHKAILAIGSTKFAEMFQAKTQDGSPPSVIQINNIPFRAFSALVEYLYTDDVYFGNDSQVMDIMVAAKAFDVAPLIARCEAYIESAEITESNVCTKLQLATSHKMESLKTRCNQFIQENTGAVIRSSDFKKATTSTIRNICKLPKFNLSSEKDLFEGIMGWIEAQPDGQRRKRELLNPLLQHIRFLTISSEAFSQLVTKYPKVFSDAEALSIVLQLNNPKANSNLPSWCNMGTNRCLTVRGAQGGNFSGVSNISSNKVFICLRPTQRGYAHNLLCMLSMNCIEGHHRIKALKLAFDENVSQDSSIDHMVITVTTEPSKFTFKEHLKIQNSAVVTVPFTRNLLARKGDTVNIRAEANLISNYRFLQFDENNSFLSQVYFECNVGSSARENRLFFISEVIFEDAPRRPGKPPHFNRKR